MKQTKLEIVCMYCGKDMGTKDGEGVEGVTTSICEKCWKERFPQWPYPEEGEE